MAYFTTMIRDGVLLFIIIGCVMAFSVWRKKLTVSAALLGGVLAICIYAGAGFTGIGLLGAFFALGIGATAVQKKKKETFGLVQKEDSKRTAGQVFANGGVAAMAGIVSFLLPPHATLLQIALAASLASATADTVSSELGVVYGRRFYNIRTLKKDTCGLDGVISWEGTLLGFLGSCVIALIYSINFGFSKAVVWIVLAGTIGNLFDSYLGATLERAHRISNNGVNFLNTLVAALVASFFFTFF